MLSERRSILIPLSRHGLAAGAVERNGDTQEAVTFGNAATHAVATLEGIRKHVHLAAAVTIEVSLLELIDPFGGGTSGQLGLFA